MNQPNPSTAMAVAIIDEFVRAGVRLAVISPGSRSGALAIAAASHPGLETRIVTDERSAGFHALGHAKCAATPALAICTSGSAPAHYLPAVIEADMSLTPLIVLSSDRPAELHGIGANQTIDQADLFGSKVRGSGQLEAADAAWDQNDEWRSTVARLSALTRGVGGKPGPVHLNVAFREPTVPISDDGRTAVAEYQFDVSGKPDGAVWVRYPAPTSPVVPVGLDPTSKGLILAGEGTYDRSGLIDQGARLGWPVVATAMSGLRGEEVVGNYHDLLVSGIPERLRPDLVYVVGAIGPSQRLESLASATTTEIRVDHWGRRLDPSSTATEVLHTDPVATLREFTGDPDPGWAESWHAADRLIRSSIVVDDHLSGPAVAAALNEVDWATLVVASSLAIRDVDARLSRAGRVIANRGASGIDGFVSTALGVASAEVRVLGLTGDLAFLHDANGFLADPRGDLVVVVVDNDGGGLFDLLPQARHAPGYERLFVAPHGRDLEDVARLHRLDYARVATCAELVDASKRGLDSGGLHMIHVVLDRNTDLQTRHRIDDAARDALRSADL
jgi:2-succinyl-5-enolpyruvyl-6-hydroxy-3-cyclohexene-1-carboxylate synthase